MTAANSSNTAFLQISLLKLWEGLFWAYALGLKISY